MNNGRDRPRALVLAPRLPLPTMSGGDLRALQTARGLARFADVAVFALEPGAGGRPDGIEVWRHSDDRSVSDPRKLAANSLRWLSEPGSHPFSRYVTPAVVAELEWLIEEFRPDLAVVETLTLAGYVETFRARGLRVVLSAHNVEGPLQREMLGSIGSGLPAPLAARLIERVECFEEEIMTLVDQIWACSERDLQLIRASYPSAAPARVVANSIDVDAYEHARRGIRRPRSVIFPANFAYPPNAAAAAWLVRELLPLLEERFGDSALVLTGGHPTREMLELATVAGGVEITGPVPDMRPQLSQASAMAVPLFQGGGTRFKVLEAFAAEVPVVSTAKAVEGLAVRHGEHYLRAEDPREFADQLGILWTEPDRRARIVESGLALVRRSYSWEAASLEMESAVDAVLGSA